MAPPAVPQWPDVIFSCDLSILSCYDFSATVDYLPKDHHIPACFDILSDYGVYRLCHCGWLLSTIQAQVTEECLLSEVGYVEPTPMVMSYELANLQVATSNDECVNHKETEEATTMTTTGEGDLACSSASVIWESQPDISQCPGRAYFCNNPSGMFSLAVGVDKSPFLVEEVSGTACKPAAISAFTMFGHLVILAC